jgi:hypothetical protein
MRAARKMVYVIKSRYRLEKVTTDENRANAKTEAKCEKTLKSSERYRLSLVVDRRGALEFSCSVLPGSHGL